MSKLITDSKVLMDLITEDDNLQKVGCFPMFNQNPTAEHADGGQKQKSMKQNIPKTV